MTGEEEEPNREKRRARQEDDVAAFIASAGGPKLRRDGIGGRLQFQPPSVRPSVRPSVQQRSSPSLGSAALAPLGRAPLAARPGASGSVPKLFHATV
jgi:hypothetical protein